MPVIQCAGPLYCIKILFQILLQVLIAGIYIGAHDAPGHQSAVDIEDVVFQKADVVTDLFSVPVLVL